MRTKKIILFIVVALIGFVITNSENEVSAVENPVSKISGEVSDSSLLTYSLLYSQAIPVNLQQQFVEDGGKIIITPVIAVNASDWNAGGVIVGQCQISGTPTIYVNSTVVDNAESYKEGTAKKVIVHEFGHYVHAKANFIKYGKYSYNLTKSFANAYAAEKGVVAIGMSETLKDSFKNTNSLKEYYANIFAGIYTEPSVMVEYYPLSTKIVLDDINLVAAQQPLQY